MLILKNYLLSILTRQPVYYLATLVTGNFSFLFFGSLMGWKIKWSRNHMFCRQSGTSSVLVQALENNSCLKESSFSSTHICEYLCFLGLVRGAKYTTMSRGRQGRGGESTSYDVRLALPSVCGVHCRNLGRDSEFCWASPVREWDDQQFWQVCPWIKEWDLTLGGKEERNSQIYT